MYSMVEDLIKDSEEPSEDNRYPVATEMREETSNAEAVDSDLDRVLESLYTEIMVFGCGGSGCNTIERMTREGIDGARLYALNTDAQALRDKKVKNKLFIGRERTRGLGAGGDPQVGEESANESEAELRKIINGSDLVFITCGLGGGTGTGSAPVITRIAKEAGALTVAVVTMPFTAEGKVRQINSERGLEKLREVADTVVVIPNDRLKEFAPQLPLVNAFKFADEVLMRAVKGITELITKPGLVNLDFNDVRTVMEGKGMALIGLGEAKGQYKAAECVHAALQSPLLEVDISQAESAIINVVGGPDMTVEDAESVIEEVYKRVHPDAEIIWGAQIQNDMEDTIQCMLVITGVTSSQILGHTQPLLDESLDIDFIE